VVWATIASSHINWLLVFVPVGIVAGAIGANPSLVFLLNFLAIIPLATVMSFATEELSAKLGSTLGGLVNATFGNAVEMIVRRGRPTDEFYKLIMNILGQHSGAPEQRNSHRASEYAG